MRGPGSSGWIRVVATLCLCTLTGTLSIGSNEPILLGRYAATLTLPGATVPFGLELARERNRYSAAIVNGSQRISVPDVRVSAGRIELALPGYMNRITARIDGSRLAGEFALVSRGAVVRTIPFAAEHGTTHRFWPAPQKDIVDLSGRWAITFEPRGEPPIAAIGEFTQRGAELAGTFVDAQYDHGALAGEVNGREFALSLFNGSWMYLYRGRVNERGEIEGTYWPGLHEPERFTGRRDAAAMAARSSRDEPHTAEAPLDFTFPDLEGRPVSLRDPRFAGKVVIVALAGSWCPSCHAEAAFLSSLYAENRVRGLEVISLMFEHFGDFEQAAAATRRFRDHHGLRYATLIAGTSDQDQIGRRLPQLRGVFAVPAAVFVDRRGRVRAIHTGFIAPAGGEHHQRLRQKFQALVDTLLAERP